MLMGLADGHDIIWDHLFCIVGPRPPPLPPPPPPENFFINSTTAKNITIQNCIISQGLQNPLDRWSYTGRQCYVVP